MKKFDYSDIERYTTTVGECFIMDGPGYDLYSESKKFRDEFNTRVAGEKREDITKMWTLAEELGDEFFVDDEFEQTFVQTVRALEIDSRMLEICEEYYGDE